MNSNTPTLRLVLDELLKKHNERTANDSLCVNCRTPSNEDYTTYIYWCKYSFCSGWCQYDYESDMRKGK